MTDNAHLELDRFRTAARNFIRTVDSVAAIEREVFLTRVSRCLAELYSSALDLPAVEPDTTNIDETPFSREKWAELGDSLRGKLGPLDAYWRVFDSTANEKPAQATLSRDISEIYFDLMDDLRIEGSGIPDSDFLWELRFSFRSHWVSISWGPWSQFTTVTLNKSNSNGPSFPSLYEVGHAKLPL